MSCVQAGFLKGPQFPSFCPTSASMALPPYTSKNSSPPIPPHTISALDRPQPPPASENKALNYGRWRLLLSLHPVCGMLSLTTWILLKKYFKPIFLEKPLA
ncbi:unnamed protein product [Arctogadus glacialis]